MTTSAKREFKRFEGFYRAGALQDQYIKRLKETYEKEEKDVIKSWFDYCIQEHGKIDQTFGEAFDILVK